MFPVGPLTHQRFHATLWNHMHLS